MRKDFIVSKIEAASDGSPYIYIGFVDPYNNKSGEAIQLNPFGSKVTGFSSPEDLMKNLPKAMGNITGMFGGAAGGGASALAETPTLKFSMREYEDIGLKVGD
jgi:hypothetical protein